MRYYFILQGKLFFRSLKNYNESSYAVLLVLLPAFIFLSFNFLKKIQYAPYIYLLLETAFILSLSEQTRNQFLTSIFLRKKYIPVRIAENLVVAFPFIAMLLYTSQYLLVFISVGLSALSAFCTFRAKFQLIIPSPFSKQPYEFSTGFRRTYWLFIIIYCTAIYSVPYHNLTLGLISLLSINVICMSFYSHFEPIFYVWIHAQTAKLFLRNKLTTALYYSLFLSLPVAVALTLFFPEHTISILLVLCLGVGYTILNILFVYVNFPVKTTQSQHIQYVAGLLLPPLLVLIIPNFYFQAVRRLKDYLLC